MSEPVLRPTVATDQFAAFRHSCVGGFNATIVDLEQAALATPLRGAATLFVKDLEVHVEPLQIVVVRPGTRVRALHHGCRAETCALLVGISATTALGRRITEDLPVPATAFSIPARWAIRLRCLFDRESAMVTSTTWDALERVLCDRLDAELEFRAGGPGNTAPRPHREIVQKVRRVLADHFDQRLPLEELSESFGVSKYHLARTFHEETGQSIHRYQMLLRLEVALTCLRRGEDDLTDLALALGFSSHSHFASVFRRLLGMTPSAARALLAEATASPE